MLNWGHAINGVHLGRELRLLMARRYKHTRGQEQLHGHFLGCSGLSLSFVIIHALDEAKSGKPTQEICNSALSKELKLVLLSSAKMFKIVRLIKIAGITVSQLSF